ncbi:MAG: hypothetical protein KDD33_03480 [Bdellovibrionales bacterium]|nr:hypothetical protein [Bdellovibrionales bacterium]
MLKLDNQGDCDYVLQLDLVASARGEWIKIQPCWPLNGSVLRSGELNLYEGLGIVLTKHSV